MNRIFLFALLIAVAGLASAADPAGTALVAAGKTPQVVPVEAALAALAAGNIAAAEQHLLAVSDPSARLYVQARIQQAAGDPELAIQTLSQLIVRYANNTNWIAKSDLLSARLYVELDMLKAADVTARQVQSLYEGTGAAGEAASLQVEIEKLKEGAE